MHLKADMSIRIAQIFLAVSLILALQVDDVFALADPDTIRLETINRYDDVGRTGDMLIVVEYVLDYTVLPTETVTEGYVGRLLDDTGQLGLVQPYSAAVIPDLGYSRGIYSFYFETEPSITGDLQVTLEGNPSLSPTPAGVKSTSITSRTASDLTNDARDIASRLETDWAASLLTLEGSLPRLNDTNGEKYFVNAIPRLRTLAPSLFILRDLNPVLNERIEDINYQDERKAYMDGTPLDDLLQVSADLTFLSKATIDVIFIILTCLLVGWLIRRFTPDHNEVPLMGMVLVFGLGAWLFGTFELVGVLAMLSIVFTGFVLFRNWQAG